MLHAYECELISDTHRLSGEFKFEMPVNLIGEPKCEIQPIECGDFSVTREVLIAMFGELAVLYAESDAMSDCHAPKSSGDCPKCKGTGEEYCQAAHTVDTCHWCHGVGSKTVVIGGAS